MTGYILMGFSFAAFSAVLTIVAAFLEQFMYWGWATALASFVTLCFFAVVLHGVGE